MAQSRYYMSVRGKMIEFPYNRIGLMQIKAHRANNAQFKYARIINVIQCQPKEIEFGKVYTLKGWETKEDFI